MRVDFQAYSFTETVTFTCEHCRKPKRKRAFTEECTLNPFNAEATTPYEVRQQSMRAARKKAELFLLEPWCATCENNLDGSEKAALRQRQKDRQ